MNEYYLNLTNQLITSEIKMSDISLEPKFSVTLKSGFSKMLKRLRNGSNQKQHYISTFRATEALCFYMFSTWLAISSSWVFKRNFPLLKKCWSRKSVNWKALSLQTKHTESLFWLMQQALVPVMFEVSQQRWSVGQNMQHYEKEVDVKQDTQGELNSLSWEFSTGTLVRSLCSPI